MKRIALLSLLFGVSTAFGAQSMGATSGSHSGMGSMMGSGESGTDHMGSSQMATGSETLTGGEVRKVDKDAGKVTIKHGPIRNLDMPGMTMVFRVKDPAMLDQVKAGDKVKFHAENINGALIVTRFESGK